MGKTKEMSDRNKSPMEELRRTNNHAYSLDTANQRQLMSDRFMTSTGEVTLCQLNQ